jgi:hypothetical protein
MSRIWNRSGRQSLAESTAFSCRGGGDFARYDVRWANGYDCVSPATAQAGAVGRSGGAHSSARCLQPRHHPGGGADRCRCRVGDSTEGRDTSRAFGPRASSRRALELDGPAVQATTQRRRQDHPGCASFHTKEADCVSLRSTREVHPREARASATTDQRQQAPARPQGRALIVLMGTPKRRAACRQTSAALMDHSGDMGNTFGPSGQVLLDIVAVRPAPLLDKGSQRMSRRHDSPSSVHL